MVFIGIDPSTKTGVVVLNEQGEVVIDREITHKGKDPERMYNIVTDVVDEIRFHNLQHGSVVCIEDFAYSQGNRMALLGGIGWGIRLGMFREQIGYTDVGTGQLKKFAGAKGNAPKDVIRLETYKRWGYEHKSDNVIDAYILAQVAFSKHTGGNIPKFQKEVLGRLAG